MRAISLALAALLAGCATPEFEMLDTALAGMAGGKPVLSKLAKGEPLPAPRPPTYDAAAHTLMLHCGASPAVARMVAQDPALLQSAIAAHGC